MTKPILPLIAVSLSLALSACGNSEGDMVAQINERLERDLCFSAPNSTRQMLRSGWDKWIDGMVKAGYAEKTKDRPNFLFKNMGYSYTDTGRSAMQNGRLCYGTPMVREVLDTSKPYEEQGRKYMTVEVETYNHVNDPWSKSKLLREDIEKNGTPATYRFVKRDKDGWVLQ